MTDWDTKRAAVGLAVAAIGSLSRAAAHLGIPLADLRRWLNGGAEVPTDVFHAAVDYLLSIQEAQLDAARDIVGRSELPMLTDTLELLLEKRRN